MELPIFGQKDDGLKPAKDFRNCAGCALITVCHPGVELAAEAEPVDISQRCATFIPAEPPPAADSLH